MIVTDLTKKIGEAMKAHDEVRLSTLRMLSSEFNYEKINKQHELSEDEELAVVRKEAKKRKEAIEAFTKAGASDKADRENSELNILLEFLPPEISDNELEKIIDDSILKLSATSMSDMGKVISLVKEVTKGNVDGGKLAMLVKNKLS